MLLSSRFNLRNILQLELTGDDLPLIPSLRISSYPAGLTSEEDVAETHVELAWLFVHVRYIREHEGVWRKASDRPEKPGSYLCRARGEEFVLIFTSGEWKAPLPALVGKQPEEWTFIPE